MGVSEAIVPGRKPEAPDDLEDDEAALWDRIVDRMPQGYFAVEHFGLLKQFCRHQVLADLIAARMAEVRKTLATDAKGWGELATLSGELDRHSNRLIALARALRLSHAARASHQAARDEAAKAPQTATPWTDWGERAARKPS